jgi:hypothetical protein
MSRTPPALLFSPLLAGAGPRAVGANKRACVSSTRLVSCYRTCVRQNEEVNSGRWRLGRGQAAAAPSYRGSTPRRRPGRQPTKPTLAEGCPDVAAQWHPSKNGSLTPRELSCGSNRKVWWRCTEGPDHEWCVSVDSRVWFNSGCPFCAGKRVSVTNSLAALHPELAMEWDAGANGLGAEGVVTGSNQIGWWRCSDDPAHRWREMVIKRTRRGYGCPYCSHHRITPKTSLAGLHPELAQEWHQTKNAPLTPDLVSVGSSQRVWWTCLRDVSHEWKASIADRATGDRTGCPFCSGRRATATTSLAALYPELSAEWHPNRNEQLTARDVKPRSEQLAWWLCQVAPDHEWQSQVTARTTNAACPFCSGRHPSSTSSLAATHPVVAAEWHPIRNGPVTAHAVTARSMKKAWWQCRVDSCHEWEAVTRNRAVLGNGCPYCSGFYASATHSVQGKHPEVVTLWDSVKNHLKPEECPPAAKTSVWWKCPAGPDHEWKAPVYVLTGGGGCPFCANRRLSMANRLSLTYPRISAEWHSVRNGDVVPDRVVFGSPAKVWWQCTVNSLHEWRTSIVARTRNGSGCPYRVLVPRSLQEILLAFELRNFLPFDVDEHKVRMSQASVVRHVDVGIVIKDHHLIVEFDGCHWHKGKELMDDRKAQSLRLAGWRVIRAREEPLLPLHDEDVQVPALAPKEAANRVLRQIERVCGLTLGIEDYLTQKGLSSEESARRHALKLTIKEGGCGC